MDSDETPRPADHRVKTCVQRGDVGVGKRLIDLVNKDNIQNLQDDKNFQNLQKAMDTMDRFEARVMKALSKVNAASEASDSVLKEYTLEQHKTMDSDEAKLNLFASAIREWKEKLATANDDTNRCLDSEQFITENSVHSTEEHAFSVGRHSLYGILNCKEDTKLGLA